MKALFVTSMHPTADNPQRGIIVQRLADAIRDLGHEVDWAQLGHHGGPWRYLRARREVAAAVGAFRPDVIHVHFGYAALAVPRVAVPLVTTFYGDDLNGTLSAFGRVTLRSRAGILVSQAAAWRSRCCITVSEPLRQRLWLPRWRRRTVVVRDAVDPRLFRPHQQPVARARLGVSASALLVLFPHDTTQPNKRLPLAQAAVEVLRRRLPAADLWIVNGRPPDEMPWVYAAADVMIVTSVHESGPSSAKEALACGLPVVSVPVGDVQLFADVPDGMVRADATPAALARALADILGRPRVERRSLLPPSLTLSTAAAATVDVYRQALVQ